MERKKYLLIILFGLLNWSLSAQNNKAIYRAFASGNMPKWKQSMDSIDAVREKSSEEILELINYQYGYIAWCISKKYPEQASQYLAKARTNLKLLEQKKHALSMLYAYKAAFAGFEIGLSPYKAPFIGQKSIDYAKTAVKLDPGNAMAYLQLGNIANYAPRMFGGSKTEAIGHYLKALDLMEKKHAAKTHNWNYLNLLVVIVNTYIDLEQYGNAKQYCIKALNVEPKFEWIRHHLHPLVLKKISDNE